MRNLRQNKKQKGFGLIEIMIGIVIVGGLMAVVISNSNRTEHAENVTTEINNAASLASLARDMFKTQGDFEGLENKILLASGMFPESMRTSGSTADAIQHSWHSDGVTLSSTQTLFANDTFVITYTDLPQRACVDISSKAYRYFESLEANGNTVTSAPTAITGCSEADDTNEIVFKGRFQ